MGTRAFAEPRISAKSCRVSKEVREVVSKCRECSFIDPATVSWTHGELGVPGNWRRLAIDVTHFQRKLFLSLVGPLSALWTESVCDMAGTAERGHGVYCAAG